MGQSIEAFVEKWQASGAAERANKDAFLIELCDVLDVPRPDPTTGEPEKDTYVFEKDAKLVHEGGVVTVGKVDLFKAGCLLLEAKQGSGAGAKKVGTAKRETPAWNVAMRDAYGQALGYARSFDKPVPFLIACDIGYCFDLYAAFDGSWNYRPFPNAQASRLFFRDLPAHRDTLRRVFLDPYGLDPSKHAAKVTREVAICLANLARKLEGDGHPQVLIATFLMRCLFTMFAEDVGLLPEGAFTKAIREYWIPSPPSFPGGIESLWRTMNEGGHVFGVVGKILKFNGGLFASPAALPLDRRALELLLAAAECNWAEVEPAIFGTLLERALDPKERHRLGAHYTPRAYVERLVRPTIEEPLRADWDVIQAQVRQLVADAAAARTEKGAKDKLKAAVEAVKEFHRRLCSIQVLDPACGSGNFLYVTLDLFKRLEGEVLAVLESLGVKQTLLHMETIRVTPGQLRGIEIKRWAKEIAELVLWIGYLQWHFRMYGRNLPVPEPVLRDDKNIECRDAVLAYDAEELVRDAEGKPVTRWDGETMKRSPVTGEEIPDESAQVPIYRYVNPRRAEWPKADFIVGNPPFVGTRRMRLTLGDGYVDALIEGVPDVPENADYVMYWWNQAAELARTGKVNRFGLITTNSISQTFNRAVLRQHLGAKEPLSIVYAIPDHPWVDSTDGAAIRVAMTVGTAGSLPGTLVRTNREQSTGTDEVSVGFSSAEQGTISEDLRAGASPAAAVPLRANARIAYWGVKFYGDGFIVTAEEAQKLIDKGHESLARPFISGRDLTGRPRGLFALDCDGLDERTLRERHPKSYQWLLERVKPVRQHNPRAFKRERWWIFGENQPGMREAVHGLERYIVTTETAKHRVFHLATKETLAEGTVTVIALDDPFFLGVLSSRIHVVWALAAGGRLGVGNDPRYNKTRCFDPFPFPDCAEAIRRQIGRIATDLDALRKRQQRDHGELTATAVYNVAEKIKSGSSLSEKEQFIREKGLASVLLKLHDDIDTAVFDAYGWPRDLTDEQILERLVALNRQRAEEERKGIVRWLRPELQNPEKAPAMAEVARAGAEENAQEVPAEASSARAALAWPKKLPEQIAAVRDLVTTTSDAWSIEQAATAFKGAKKKDVEDVLDGLTALGLLVSYEVTAGRRWKATRPAP